MFKYNRVLTSQPQGAVEIDWSNPLTRGLESLMLGSNTTFNPTGVVWTKNGVETKSVSKLGVGLVRNKSNCQYYPLKTANGGSNDWTIAGIFIPLATFVDAQMPIGVADTVGDAPNDRCIRASSGSWSGYVYDGAAKYATSSKAFAVGIPDTIVVSANGTTMTCGVAGVPEVSTGISNNGYTGYSAAKFVLGDASSGLGATSVAMPIVVRATRAWSYSERQSFLNNPWQIFKPRTFLLGSLSASITLSQSSRFDNSNSLSYTHSISQVGGAQSLTQSARHDNGSTFYTHSLAAGAVGLTQSSRFDNTNGLAYAHTLAASISLPQGARFDNANGLSYVHVLSASITLAQSARFDNSNGLAYQHSISQAGGTQSLDQSARYDNTNGLSYQHTVSAGTVTLAQSARFDNAAQFFAHTVVQAADQFIFPAYYENANGFYQHQIGDGSVEIASGGAFHPPRIDDPRKRRRRDDETLLVIGAI